jgi:hypothetical protein
MPELVSEHVTDFHSQLEVLRGMQKPQDVNQCAAVLEARLSL